MYSNLDLMRKRLAYQGGNAEGRLHKEKLRSLEGALKYSYQAETIVKDGLKYRALINSNKLKPDYDDKIISIPHSSQMKVGDIFQWPRTNSKWIVYLQQLTEDAYFRGYIRKAEHTMRWKDEFGNVLEIDAAVRGPVETKTRSLMKSGISFDEPNYTLSIVVPSNENTKKLKRYSRVTIAEQPWEVVAVDSISEVGVIEMGLVEDYLNRETDTKELVGGKVERIISVSSCLDELTEARLGVGIPLWTEALVNNVSSDDVNNSIKYSILEGDAQIINNNLTILQEGIVKVQLSISEINYVDTFEINGVTESTKYIVDFDITGEGVVKSFGTSVYTIVKYENGQVVEAQGQWQLKNNPSLFKVLSADRNRIEFEWMHGKYGTVELSYIEDGRTETKTIKVEGLL